MKIYKLELSNKEQFQINEDEKQAILKSNSQFVQLKTGEVINKSFIVSMTLNYEEMNYMAMKERDKKLLEN